MDLYSLPDIPLDDIAKTLSTGGVMIYPTETVAGIGAIGSDRSAVNRVFDIKQRSYDKPVSYACADRLMVERYAVIPDWIDPLFELLPGSLTLVLPRADDSPPAYGVGQDTIGIRIPAVDWLLELINLVGEPVISTSANVSGQPSAHSVAGIPESMQSAVDILISWEGELHGMPSTVVGLDHETETIEIYRKGAIPPSKLYSLL